MKIRVIVSTVAVWLVAAPGTARACPVCVGLSDSPLASGMNAGVLVLLAVTAVVLGGIFLVGRSVVARSTVHARPAEDGADVPGRSQRDVGRTVRSGGPSRSAETRAPGAEAPPC